MNEHIRKNQIIKKELLYNIENEFTETSEVGCIGGYISDAPYMRTPDLLEMMKNALIGKSAFESRKEYASEYLEEAKDYSVHMASKTAELYTVIARVESIEVILGEEDVILEELKKSLTFNRNMEYSEIVKRLRKLISDYIIAQTGEPNSVYQTTLEELRNLSLKY